jgi:hypothetical protein
MVSTWFVTRCATCRRCLVGSVIKPRQTSTAKETEDAELDQLLAQADYIMRNPDEFLTESVETVAQAEVEEAVMV